ncbi:flagellin N-terminal helical domain-containing protein [Litorisediminicola beolgyonensis]|uniref:Flagellin n=1 Tax=Litorisediminicola beolgyonensis TaxID=1173614 RepID=A0ABW3ZFW0_9RHOB
MSSILTNNSAMTALATLRGINKSLDGTQNRISTGLKIESGKDNAAYFAISRTMDSESNMYKAIDESLTLKQNSVSTARLGAETVADIAEEFVERVAFAQGSAGDASALADIQSELDALVDRINTTINQATFNGESLVTSASTQTLVTGVTRSGGSLSVTTITFNAQDLNTSIAAVLAAIDVTSTSTGALTSALTTAQGALDRAISAATNLGVAEKSIETQKEFLSQLTDRIDSGVGSMIDADMEEEAARLQALQVQQQLATQSLSIANQAPQNILSLFR